MIMVLLGVCVCTYPETFIMKKGKTFFFFFFEFWILSCWRNTMRYCHPVLRFGTTIKKKSGNNTQGCPSNSWSPHWARPCQDISACMGEDRRPETGGMFCPTMLAVKTVLDLSLAFCHNCYALNKSASATLLWYVKMWYFEQLKKEDSLPWTLVFPLHIEA